MATVDQVQEMIDGTNHTYTSISGVNGIKITNKTDSTKYIFFPAAGGWYDTNNSTIGSYGNYWSTTYQSADSNANRAFTLDFYMGSSIFSQYLRNGYTEQYNGLPVRAIR